MNCFTPQAAPAWVSRTSRRRMLLGLSATLAFVASFTQAPHADDGSVISAQEALALARSGDIVLIDVRSTEEWRQTGVPSGARAVTMSRVDPWWAHHRLCRPISTMFRRCLCAVWP